MTTDEAMLLALCGVTDGAYMGNRMNHNVWVHSTYTKILADHLVKRKYLTYDSCYTESKRNAWSSTPEYVSVDAHKYSLTLRGKRVLNHYEQHHLMELKNSGIPSKIAVNFGYGL